MSFKNGVSLRGLVIAKLDTNARSLILKFICVVLATLLLMPIMSRGDTESLVFESSSGNGHILFPALDAKHFTDEQWQVFIEALRARQLATNTYVTLFLTGETADDAYERAEPFLQRLEASKVDYEIIFAPQNILAELSSHTDHLYEEVKKLKLPEQRRLQWKHLLRSSDSRDWIIGSAMGLLAGGVNAYFWFYQAPLEPHIAWAMVAATAVPTFYHNFKLKTLDRVYRFKLSGRIIGKRVRTLTEVSKRQLVNLFYAQLYRFILSPVGQTAPAWTLQGQIEIFMHVAAFGTSSAFFSAQRNRYFRHRPETSRWLNLYNYLIMAPLIVRDLGGLHLYTWNLGPLELRDSTFAMVAANVTLAGLLHFEGVRHTLEEWIDKQDQAINRLRNWISSSIKSLKTLCTTHLRSKR